MIKLLTRHLDPLIGLSLFLLALYAYGSTLAPTVLQGDPALFQFTPYVLGVTYPTGFPLYLLLGKLWLTIFPFGEIAWRMNLFSALCAALAMPWLYLATYRLFEGNHYRSPQLFADSPQMMVDSWLNKNLMWHEGWPPRLAALITVLTFATLPTFWRWATSAKTYTLNILCLSIILYLLSRLSKPNKSDLQGFKNLVGL